jgi:chemotaxis protein methyltransferase CheR
VTPVGAVPAPVIAPELTRDEFQGVTALLHSVAGIALLPGKEGLVRARLSPRLRALGMPNVKHYLDYIGADTTGTELATMVDVLTTNKTSFFREPEHFEYLQHQVFPQLAKHHRPVRIWSAGCSSGEEPYTLAMLVRETCPLDLVRRTRILATDISRRVLARARQAVYPIEAARDIPTAVATRHLHRAPDGSRGEKRVAIAEDTRALVTFARLNLMGSWPMHGPFDVILCRNVMIYFDRPTQERLVQRFAQLLGPDGHLFVGHSESLTAIDHGLQYRRPAVYQR